MSWEYSKIDDAVIERWKKLGNLGEWLAEVLLKKSGFTKVRNLNKESSNETYADIYAVKNKVAYIISVKTRNKYENNGRLNSRYKLGKDCYQCAMSAESKYRAKAAWITIAIDVGKGTYDAYFGLLSILGCNTGVLMTREATNSYDCLERGGSFEKLGITKDKLMRLKNVYKLR